jgi:chromosome segregation ATPase
MTSAPPLAATTSLPRRRSRLLGSPAGELEFSILTGEHKGRQVRLRGAKCTIGSGQGCTLRLRARGVQALHCWILRGAGGTIIRRRHRNTQLNGSPFDDAVLAPGDRLRIGSVELEVSRCPAWSADWSAGTAQPLPVYDEIDRELWERAARESAELMDGLRAEMQDLERRATSQLAELNELMGRVSSERDSLQEQLRRVQFDAASQRDTYLFDKQRLEAALAVGEQELAELRTHLTTREVEIESVLLTESRRVSDIQGKLEEVLRERSALETHLQDQADSLRMQCTARQAERDQLDEECRRLDMQLAQLRELVGYTAAERDQMTLQVDGTQRSLVEQHEQLRRENLDLQNRLDATQARLNDAERRLTVLQVDGERLSHGELERANQLQQRLDDVESHNSELELQLRESSVAWQTERQQLTEQQQRLIQQYSQLEGQLIHVRELVESLAAEKDSLCQQLESADLRLAAEQEAFAAERASFTRQLADQQSSLVAAEQRCSQLQAQLDERRTGNDAQAALWQRQSEEYEEQIRTMCEQLATVTGRLDELQTTNEANREIDSVLATKWQAEAINAREELAALQVKLADADTRLAAVTAESQAHTSAEREQRAAWERRAGELQYLLAAADLKVAAAEDRLAKVQAENAERLGQTDAAGRHWEQRAAENESQRAALELQLAELTEAVRFERETWQHDRDRLHQECRMLGHRLIQKQKDLDALEDRFRAAAQDSSEVATLSQNTITMDQMRGQMADAASLDQQPAEWETEREGLRRKIEELESQLASRPASTQEMTTGPDAFAPLQTQTHGTEQEHELRGRIAALELEIESARLQLEESHAWQERAEATSAELEQRHSQIEQLRESLAAVERELAAVRAAPHIVATAEADDGAQLVELQQVESEQPAALESSQQSLELARAQLATEAELLSVAQQELAAQQAELRSAQAEFENRWRMWEENLRRQEEALQLQADELSQRVSAAQTRLSESAALEQVFAEREAQLQAEASRLAEARADLDRRLAEVTPNGAMTAVQPSCEQISDDVHDCESAHVPAEDVPQAEGPIADEFGAARDAADRGLSALSAPAMPEHCAPQFVAASAPGKDTLKPVWNQPGQASPPADDDSIEAYMARLLTRVRGDSPVGAPGFTPAPAPLAVPAVVPASPVVEAPVSPAEPVTPEEYVPRQKAPELNTNMAAMRELANSAARTAIVKHQKRSGHRQALTQSVGALLTLICGLGAALGAHHFHSLPAAAAAALGIAVAMYWGGKAAIHALRMMMLKAPGCTDVDDESSVNGAAVAVGESLHPAADLGLSETPAEPTETLHPDYIAPELSQPQDPSTH